MGFHQIGPYSTKDILKLHILPKKILDQIESLQKPKNPKSHSAAKNSHFGLHLLFVTSPNNILTWGFIKKKMFRLYDCREWYNFPFRENSAKNKEEGNYNDIKSWEKIA